ncbi:MAG: bacteriochlorophyll 4-vinyl reductase [Chloroflexota bacterium]|nr:bacteriochlorophyll 4-vinyl reductase [Chloroflexota bacterium]
MTMPHVGGPEQRNHSGESLVPGAKMGPNSIIQTVGALKEFYGTTKALEILKQGGKERLGLELPSEMTDQREFISLSQMLFRQLDIDPAMRILKRSGQRTAHYLLKNRIPKFAQVILHLLPRQLGLKLLLTAIGKNAWTFAGSGTYSFVLGKSPTITLQNCIGCLDIQASKPVCSYYAGTFETLLKNIIDTRIQVEEIKCQANGASACTFSVTFS